MEFKNKDFETQKLRYDENTKVVLQLRKAHTRARESIKMFKAGSCDVRFFCLNMRIEA